MRFLTGGKTLDELEYDNDPARHWPVENMPTGFHGERELYFAEIFKQALRKKGEQNDISESDKAAG